MNNGRLIDHNIASFQRDNAFSLFRCKQTLYHLKHSTHTHRHTHTDTHTYTRMHAHTHTQTHTHTDTHTYTHTQTHNSCVFNTTLSVVHSGHTASHVIIVIITNTWWSLITRLSLATTTTCTYNTVNLRSWKLHMPCGLRLTASQLLILYMRSHSSI